MKEVETNTKEVENLLTREETARLLNCNLVTLWRYTRAQKFPFYRAGRKMFFKREEVLNAIKVG